MINYTLSSNKINLVLSYQHCNLVLQLAPPHRRNGSWFSRSYCLLYQQWWTRRNCADRHGFQWRPEALAAELLARSPSRPIFFRISLVDEKGRVWLGCGVGHLVSTTIKTAAVQCLWILQIPYEQNEQKQSQTHYGDPDRGGKNVGTFLTLRTPGGVHGFPPTRKEAMETVGVYATNAWKVD